MRRVIVAGMVVCFAAGAGAGVGADEKKGADQKKRPAEKDFLGFWMEERRESGGKVHDKPDGLLGWHLSPRDASCWARRGESTIAGLGKARVRTDKEPVWLDIIGTSFKVKLGSEWVEKVHIRPGIAKREGKKLIWVWSTGWYTADPKDIADFPTRPKSFDVKKDDPWEKMTLYPSSGFYEQD